jgi:hypothetical protein
VHKVKERMSAWRSFEDKETSFEDLPAAFRQVKGHADPPFAEYSELVDIEEIMDAHFSMDMQRTLFAQLLADDLPIDRQLEPRHRAYRPACDVEYPCIYIVQAVQLNLSAFKVTTVFACRYNERHGALSDNFMAHFSDMHLLHKQARTIPITYRY